MKKSILLLFSLLLFVWACSSSSDTEEPVTPVTPTPTTNKISYFQFQTDTKNDLNITKDATNTYTIVTTGGDPYIYLSALTKSLPSDSTVLTFEYKASAEISDVQIFFASPISEERSSHVGTIPAASSWTTWSVTLGDERKKFSWGNSGNFLRMDYGTSSGITLNIRNIYFRGMNATEKAAQEAKDNRKTRLAQFQTNLSSYLSKTYSSTISTVKVTSNQVSIDGTCSGDGTFYLCEVTPYQDVTETTRFTNRTAISSKSFSLKFDRYVQRDGYNYDRLLSKWVIVKEESSTKDAIDSHAHYADDITATRSLSAGVLKTKKGLGGFYKNSVTSDLDDLGIHSVTVNIAFTEFTYASAGNGRIAHEYGGKTYYFDSNYINRLDATLLECYKRGIVVSAIILIQKSSADNSLINVFKHPDCNGGNYSMANMTTAESTNLYAAVIDFLMNRYSRVDGLYGRIHHFIMHNEVDYSTDWTNMGSDVPMLVYLDTYVKSMRLCYNIARSYDANAQVLGSFTHSWTSESATDYSSKKMLEGIISFSKAEGDFQWGVAYHPYPQDLTKPDTWNDSEATYSSSSPYVTFKNLEVINDWILQSSSKYLGKTKRTLWLSENGTNSPSYSDNDLARQAAGAAWACKKITKLTGIDGIQWHNWIDNRAEYGLCIGLRRYSDDSTDPLGKKPVWYLYQAWGTDKEDAVFDKYLSVIGVSSWDKIFYTGY
jgi:hypothetical protein